MLRLQGEVGLAVLYRTYADAAYSGRETAGGSASLDEAYDRVEKAFEELENEIVRRTQELLLAEIRKALTGAVADVEHARQVVQSPAAGNDQWRTLHENRGVARGLARAIEQIEKVKVT